MRSESHSSSSTALDSAPRTPADFTKEEPEQMSSLVRIVSVSRQVSSPTDMSSEGHELVDKEQVPELPPVPAIEPQQYGLPDEDHQEMSYLDSEPSTRISAVYSEGDVVEGIGLSLLQNFIGGEVDDDSVRSFRTNTHYNRGEWSVSIVLWRHKSADARDKETEPREEFGAVHYIH